MAQHDKETLVPRPDLKIEAAQPSIEGTSALSLKTTLAEDVPGQNESSEQQFARVVSGIASVESALRKDGSFVPADNFNPEPKLPGVMSGGRFHLTNTSAKEMVKRGEAAPRAVRREPAHRVYRGAGVRRRVCVRRQTDGPGLRVLDRAAGVGDA